MNPDISLLTVFIIHIAYFYQSTNELQFRKQCVPDSIDRRYEVCSCAKQLNLNCDYRNDINEISVDKQDPAVRSIKLSINNKENDDITRIYFPNLDYFSIKYEVINLKSFPYIPKYAFYNEYHLRDDQFTYTIINFEYSLDVISEQLFDFGGDSDDDDDTNDVEKTKTNINDKNKLEKKVLNGDKDVFIIDEYAFSGINVNKILLEGDYNSMKFNIKSIKHSNINEIKINCFTKLNIKNSKDCAIEFADKIQMYSVDEKNSTRNLLNKIKARPTILNELKLYGLTINQDQISLPNEWNIDLIPNINELKVLHVVNTKSRINSLRKFYTQKPNDVLPLVELSLRDNIIAEIDETFLMKNKLSNLLNLDLANNLITTIELNTFRYLQKLETLDLSNNKLTYLSNFVFSGLKNLKTLNLKSNQISNLIPNQFSTINMLEFLDLSSNRISYLDNTNFKHLENLKTLQIEFNPFERISNETFKFISNLKLIDLTSKFNKEWFYFDNSDICLLKYFKCKNTKILLSTEQNCNCFLYYVNLINLDDNNSNKETTIPNDNTQFLRNCEATCDHSKLLSKCFDDELNENYSQSCLYKVLYPQETTTTTTTKIETTELTTPSKTISTTLSQITTTTTTTIINNKIKDINAEPTNFDDKSNIITSMSNNYEDANIRKVQLVRTLELKNLVYLSIFLSCLSLGLLFLFTIIFSCMHVRYHKHATYNTLSRVEH